MRAARSRAGPLIHRRAPRRRQAEPNRCGKATATRSSGKVTDICAAPPPPSQSRFPAASAPRRKRHHDSTALQSPNRSSFDRSVRAGQAAAVSATPMAALAFGLKPRRYATARMGTAAGPRPRQRIHAQSGCPRSFVEPLSRPLARTGFVIDDDRTAIGESVDTIDAEAEAEVLEHEHQLHLGADQTERRTLEFQVEPCAEHVGDAPRFAVANDGRQRTPACGRQCGQTAGDSRRNMRRPLRSVERGERVLVTRRGPECGHGRVQQHPAFLPRQTGQRRWPCLRAHPVARDCLEGHSRSAP